MKFSGEFELDGVSPEDAWLVLTDPIAIEKALPGCKYIRRIEGEDHDFDAYEPDEDVQMLPQADRAVVEERSFDEGRKYATLMQVGVGSMTPSFESVVTIEDLEGHSMTASGSGATVGSAFTMNSVASVSEIPGGSVVEWEFETDISGRIAQLNPKTLETVADRTVHEFMGNIQDQMLQVTEVDLGDEAEDVDDRSLIDRVVAIFGTLTGRPGT